MVFWPVGWQRTQSVISVPIICGEGVLSPDVVRVVAVVAGVGLVVARHRVAGGTGDDPPPAMIEREDVLERAALPGIGVVAGRAVGAKQPPVDVILGVAADAGLGRAPEDIVHMAVGAGSPGHALPVSG